MNWVIRWGGGEGPKYQVRVASVVPEMYWPPESIRIGVWGVIVLDVLGLER